MNNAAIPDTAVTLPSLSGEPSPVEVVAVVDLPAGQHIAGAYIGCPSGDVSGSPAFGNGLTWTVLRLGASG